MIRRHPHLIDKVIGTSLHLVNFSSDILDEMVELTAKPELNNLLIALWRAYSGERLEDKLIETSGFDKLVIHANSSLKDPELAISSLTFCAELASSNFPLFSAISA